MGSLNSLNPNVVDNVDLGQLQDDLIGNIFSYIFPFTLRSIVELGIPNIIHSHGKPMSVSQIISCIKSPSFNNVKYLSRVMRFLSYKKIFTIHKNQSSNKEEVLYGLTPTCELLLHGHDLTVVPILMAFTDPWMMATWHEMSGAMVEGGNPVEKTHGISLWDKCKRDPWFNNLFNNAMVNANKINMGEILEGYKDGFRQIIMNGSLVDVGGGIGQAVAEIVKNHPHIRGFNFDLPHVVATAPPYHGVTHVAGDMFHHIPSADVIFMKHVLHDWEDEECVKILKNCHKAVCESKGKVIIAEIVIDAQENDYYEEVKSRYDLLTMSCIGAGKERTVNEFGILLNKAGFLHYKILTFPYFISIIEAYPHQ